MVTRALYLVGLTGGLASGKSTVAALLSAAGFPVVDADKVGHELLGRATGPLREQVLALLGRKVLDEQGAIDRKRVAAAVFADGEVRRKLEAILHPAIGEQVRKQAWELTEAGHRVVVLEVPLLFEVGWDTLMDLNVVVDCPPDVQSERFVGRGGTGLDAERRMASQMSRDKRLARADVVLDNSRTHQHLEAEVRRLVAILREKEGQLGKRA